MAAGGDVPHDLATFVIEQALGIEHGFWGCVADGATFRSLDRRRTQHGKAVIARHLVELDDAERRVNEVYFAWRRGEPTACDTALDDALAEWRALPEHGEMIRRWVVDRARHRASHGARHGVSRSR